MEYPDKILEQYIRRDIADAEYNKALREGYNHGRQDKAENTSEMVAILKKFCDQYDAMPDGELGKGLTNVTFLEAKELLGRLDEAVAGKNNELMVALPLSADSDEDVASFEFRGEGRLILVTKHGEVIIDIRCGDVNSFVFNKSGERIDHLLIKP